MYINKRTNKMEKAEIKRTSIIVTPELEEKIAYIKSQRGTTSTTEVVYQSIHEACARLKESELKRKND